VEEKGGEKNLCGRYTGEMVFNRSESQARY